MIYFRFFPLCDTAPFSSSNFWAIRANHFLGFSATFQFLLFEDD